MTLPRDLSQARRVVIKIGSALLVDQSDGSLHRTWLDALGDDVAALKRQGKEIILVSSGSIAVGWRLLGLAKKPVRLEEKQAAAASGQIVLAHAYQETLARHGVSVAQVLLTPEDTENRRRYLNARNTLDTLLKLGAVPVINENDTVATSEIRFGDNDRLAARVAAMMGADTLVLLSDIDGLYTADPGKDPNAEFIPEVGELTPEIEAMAGASGSYEGSGGMVTKLMAARICMGAGCRMTITLGKTMHPLTTLAEGGKATWFCPHTEPKAARKAWIMGHLKPSGEIAIDGGALRALLQGNSLLPVGVVKVEGDFERGDAVTVRDLDGRLVGKGLIAYSAADARQIMGNKSHDIETLLGYRGREEMIHRDDLVLEQRKAGRGA